MENSVFDQFKAVRVYKEAGKPSLHKPVLLLYALSQCYQGQNRLIPFSVVDQVFNEFFYKFSLVGLPSNSHYPFGKLENDGVWEVIGSELLNRTSAGHLFKKELLIKNISGGFVSEVFDALINDKHLTLRIINYILTTYFDKDFHKNILNYLDIANCQHNESEQILKEKKTMALIGNQKFAISRWWLSKGIEIIQTNPDIFSSRNMRDAMKFFIAGSAVIKAINGWLLAAQIMEKGGNGLTNFGLSLADNDPKLIKSSTWWSIHLALSFSDRSEPYRQFFLTLDTLTKDWISWNEILNRINNVIEESAEQSISSNLDGIKKMFKEGSPLAELGIIENREGQAYARLGSPVLSDEIIIHALAMARFAHFRSRESVDFTTLSNVGIHNFLCCSKDHLRQQFRRMAQMNQWQSYFSFDQAADLDSITFKDDCDPNKTVLLLLQKGQDTWL